MRWYHGFASVLCFAGDGFFVCLSVLRAKFMRDGTIIRMLANKSRADAELTYNGESGAELWNPSDGSVTPVAPGETVTVPAMRAIFVLY